MSRVNLKIASAVLLCALISVCFGHRVEAGNQKNQKSIESYVVPDVVLTNQKGVKVSLRSLLQNNKPVMLAFIYSSCTTVCPVLSTTFANVQNRLAPDTQRVQLVSISIDPEHDTPKVMMEYLKTYHAKPGWDFLSGSPEDTATIMKSFGLKEMSYNYFTLIRTSPDTHWIKITGLLNAAEVVTEYLQQ